MGHADVPAFLPVTAVVPPRTRHVANLRMTTGPPAPRVPPQPVAAAAASAMAAVAIAGLAFSGGALVAPPTADASVFDFRGERPVGIVGKPSGGDRYLSQCPSTNNCVSTAADVYDKHYLPPWTYNPKGEAETVSGAAALKGKRSTAYVEGNQKPMADAVADLVKVIQESPGATIITNRPTHSEVGDGWYIYAEFQSKFFGFVDDVEFLFLPDNSTVEYRSASRMGESDFKANRTRIRDLRIALKPAGWKSLGF